MHGSSVADKMRMWIEFKLTDDLNDDMTEASM